MMFAEPAAKGIRGRLWRLRQEPVSPMDAWERHGRQQQAQACLDAGRTSALWLPAFRLLRKS